MLRVRLGVQLLLLDSTSLSSSCMSRLTSVSLGLQIAVIRVDPTPSGLIVVFDAVSDPLTPCEGGLTVLGVGVGEAVAVGVGVEVLVGVGEAVAVGVGVDVLVGVGEAVAVGVGRRSPGGRWRGCCRRSGRGCPGGCWGGCCCRSWRGCLGRPGSLGGSVRWGVGGSWRQRSVRVTIEIIRIAVRMSRRPRLPAWP